MTEKRKILLNVSAPEQAGGGAGQAHQAHRLHQGEGQRAS